ncbi:hypothetical protein A5714_24665 [Mycobacterium sp. E2462]|nr:hypothetical protein A5700_07455 [Mycobacterium sp. E1214]OBH22778.1 hypothetical protein A5693_13135 [Mycobacterium sp. E1319]OBI05355.1 hypothetical protein A5714_24665 [Mycobacterium sp. E2462]
MLSLPRAFGGHTDEDFRLPGLAAAATWIVGLATGVFALLAAQAGMAIVALVVAVVAPWVAMAWVSRAQRHAYNGTHHAAAFSPGQS